MDPARVDGDAGTRLGRQFTRRNLGRGRQQRRGRKGDNQRQNSKEGPVPRHILSPIRHATTINGRSFVAPRQPLGFRGVLPQNVGMKGQFDDLSAWRGMAAPSLAEIEALAADAYARLPEHFRGLCENLIIQVADFPTEEVLDQMKVETEFDLLGLFQGVGLPFQSTSVLEPLPNMVWLYRRPILDYWAEHEDSLGAIVTHVLVHEIGHHFGLSDAAMEAIEASAD